MGPRAPQWSYCGTIEKSQFYVLVTKRASSTLKTMIGESLKCNFYGC